MMLLLTLLFCLACRVWQRAKVNYAFIFEFDTRHHLDWRQLSEVNHNHHRPNGYKLILVDTVFPRLLSGTDHVAQFQPFRHR